MNNFKWFALFVSLLFSACASDSSVSSAEKNEETSTGSSEMISSSSISYGIIPIDTSSAQKGSDAGIDDMISMTSSSKTYYRFTTEQVKIYDTLGIYVNAYYEEKGLCGNDNRVGGSAIFTYRLLNSPTDSIRTFVGWLLDGAYWSDNCVQDSTYFSNRCAELVGELVDYNEGCSVNKLQLSCVYPYEYTDSVEALNSIAKEFLNFAIENWVEIEEPKEDSSMSSASSKSL